MINFQKSVKVYRVTVSSARGARAEAVYAHSHSARQALASVARDLPWTAQYLRLGKRAKIVRIDAV